MQSWANAVSDPTSSTSSGDVDVPDTAHIRQQLLGLQEAWSDFGEQGRWAILELLVGSLSTEVLQRNAQHVAAVYAGLAETKPPPALLELRINLRRKDLEQPDGERRGERSQKEQEATQTKSRRVVAKAPGEDSTGVMDETEKKPGIREETKEAKSGPIATGEAPTRRGAEMEENQGCHDQMEEAWRQQYEEMKNEETMMDLALHEAYEEQLAMEAQEAFEREQVERNGEQRGGHPADTAVDSDFGSSDS